LTTYILAVSSKIKLGAFYTGFRKTVRDGSLAGKKWGNRIHQISTSNNACTCSSLEFSGRIPRITDAHTAHEQSDAYQQR